MKKYTAKDYEEMAKKAEEKAKEYKAKAKKITDAEEAKVNAEIIKAVKELQESYPEKEKPSWDSMPGILRKWAEKNRVKNYGQQIKNEPDKKEKSVQEKGNSLPTQTPKPGGEGYTPKMVFDV